MTYLKVHPVGVHPGCTDSTGRRSRIITGLRSFEQPRGSILRDRQRTAPDSTSLNNDDRVL
jgi:hypothetical protein